jgi:hypothetical protein
MSAQMPGGKFESGGIDWGQFRPWQIFDPVPWWVLDKEILQEILVAQLETRRDVLALEQKQLDRFVQIVRGGGRGK